MKIRCLFGSGLLWWRVGTTCRSSATKVAHCCFFAFALLGCGALPAQEFELDTNALRQAFEAAEVWAKENLDEDVLRALQQVDREKVEQFLRDYQKQLEGEYVLDLATLKGAATAVLPLLEAHEETQPYAVWLKAQLDYLVRFQQRRSEESASQIQSRLGI